MKYALLAFSFIVITSCMDDNPTDPPPDGSGLIPLIEGNYWEYSQTVLRNGELADSGLVRIDIHETVEAQGQTWYKLTEGEFEDPLYYRLTSSGLMEYKPNPEDFEDGISYLLYKYPASIGESWDADGNILQLIGDNETVQAIDQSIYSCFYYRTEDEDGFEEAWIKPELGLIRWKKQDQDFDSLGNLIDTTIERVLREWEVQEIEE